MANFLIFGTLLTVFSISEAGFLMDGLPCSARNTAYYRRTKLDLPKDDVKCIDITAIDRYKIRGLQIPFKNADTLYADGMMLKRVPRAIVRSLPHLIELDLSRNKLKMLHKMVFVHNKNLKKLFLHKNQISFKHNAPFLTSNSITDLVLSNNRINKITKATFSQLPNLRNLFLDRNQLTVLHYNTFSLSPMLKYLNVEYNCIKEIPEKHALSESLHKFVYGNQCMDSIDGYELLD